MPDFTKYINIRIDAFDSRAQLLAEQMGNFICHIQAQTIDSIIFYPIGTDINKVFAHCWITRVQFWHVVKKRERIELLVFCGSMLKIQWPGIDHKPVIIFGLRSFCKYILPWFKIISTMVKHTIQHNTNAPLMRFLYQCTKSLFISKSRINLCIIRRVILVV